MPKGKKLGFNREAGKNGICQMRSSCGHWTERYGLVYAPATHVVKLGACGEVYPCEERLYVCARHAKMIVDYQTRRLDPPRPARVYRYRTLPSTSTPPPVPAASVAAVFNLVAEATD